MLVIDKNLGNRALIFSTTFIYLYGLLLGLCVSYKTGFCQSFELDFGNWDLDVETRLLRLENSDFDYLRFLGST